MDSEKAVLTPRFLSQIINYIDSTEISFNHFLAIPVFKIKIEYIVAHAHPRELDKLFIEVSCENP